jgi:MFS family permease
MPDSHRMSAAELRASFALAGIFGLRMLGMFIILPVFALYAEHLPGGSDHLLVGLALGAYGLTQALLQIPFGWLSDRWGRKPAIYGGLAIFALGSLIAALAQDIYIVILGRVIQGAGAVSAAVIALAADLTREDQRTKAMAIIGLTIGAAFAVSMVAGPVLNRAVGVPGIFALTGALALLAMAVVRWLVPDPPAGVVPGVREPMRFTAILRHAELARLNYGIFVLHAVLMALFMVVPFSLRDAGLAADSHWQVYLPVMVGSVLLILPPMLAFERRGRHRPAFLGAIAVLLAGEVLLAQLSFSLWGMSLALLLFFAGFNLLEAALPALVSRTAPPEARGTAAGVYGSVQFLGAFAGATTGGLVSQQLGASAVFVLCSALTFSWLLVAWPMAAPAAVGVRT